MVPIVSIVGLSGSGKTTLLEKVVTELTKRGYSIGTVKHDAHGFEIDREGKDSWRHRKAGARTVALSSPDKFAVIKDVDSEWPPERLISTYLTDVDCVITEGYKKSPFPKIEVVRKAVSSKPVCAGDKLMLGYATDLKLKGGKLPVFDLNDYMGVASLIEDKIIKRHKRATVTLTVNGGNVTLKPFIETLLREGVAGMIKSLKGCEDPVEIELRIRRK